VLVGENTVEKAVAKGLEKKGEHSCPARRMKCRCL